MTLDRTRWPELLVGLDQIRVLDVARDNDNRVHVAVETTDSTALCTGCGNAATVKDRPLVRLADLPVFGSASILVWRKRRWVCRQGACPVGSWTENRCDIAPPRAQMTTRAGLWATREVGAEIHTVSYVATQIGVSWNTIMNAVSYWGEALITDPTRTGSVTALGVDETKMGAAKRFVPTTWISAICDLEGRSVIDVIEGRGGTELGGWLDDQSAQWREKVTVTVTDLHQPYRNALSSRCPNATAVADPFHVVGVANRALDRTRRAVQNETLGHRGHTKDPLYRARKLLVMAAENIDVKGQNRLEQFLAAGDPHRRVYEAWVTKEAIRDLYTMHAHPVTARAWLDVIIDSCRDTETITLRGLARTLKQWKEPILAWHTHGYSNGPVEGLNSLIKKVKRVASGFTNFSHYRTRILLAVGACNWDLLGTPPPKKPENPAAL